MLNIVLCFHLHQPYRLKKLTFFDIGEITDPFDSEINRSIIEKYGQKYYIPANKFLIRLAERTGGRFKFSISLSGTAAELLKCYNPWVMDLFIELAEKGYAEFIGETYYYSVDSNYDPEEFTSQISLHLSLLGEEFGAVPSVFWYTGVFDERIAEAVGSFKNFRVLFLEEAGTLYPCRTTNGRFFILFKDHSFSNMRRSSFSGKIQVKPFATDEFLHGLDTLYNETERGKDVYLNLFFDYHIFEKNGFLFFEKLAEHVLNHSEMRFIWPSGVAHRYGEKLAVYSPGNRTDSTWRFNDLQKNAAKAAFVLINKIKSKGKAGLLETVRRLTSIDHFYWMDDRYNSTPEGAYLSFLYVLTDIEEKLSR